MSEEVNELKVNKQFYQIQNSSKRLRILQGGTRSGKTFAVLQYIFVLCLDTPPEKSLRITIVRKFLPSLQKSAYYDFIEILKEHGYYDERKHHKSPHDLRYELNGHTVEFMATGDNPDRLRSISRNICYINEALELTKEEFRQINYRTTDFIICDYNPSESEHWLYNMIDDEDTDFFISTYKDNNFLSDVQVKEIERDKERDPTAWKVFGEGKRATALKGRIYSGWNKIDTLPEDGEIFYGLDFGYDPDPTALVKLVKMGEALYCQEVLYQTQMQTSDIIRAIHQNPIGRVYCDHNQKQIIEELRRAGIDAQMARKGAGSIAEGIDFVKRTRVYVTEDSTNLWREYSTYQWNMKKGFDADDPNAWEKVPKRHQADHLLDALRYGYHSHYFTGKRFFVV